VKCGKPVISGEIMESILTLALMLLPVHVICDYPCRVLCKAKQSGPLRVYHLVAHSGIQGAHVGLVTGNVWLGLTEWVFHTVIDEAKVKGPITFTQAQALHLGCKALWLGYLVVSITLSSGQSILPWWR
jgi:hypothetical protein